MRAPEDLTPTARSTLTAQSLIELMDDITDLVNECLHGLAVVIEIASELRASLDRMTIAALLVVVECPNATLKVTRGTLKGTTTIVTDFAPVPLIRGGPGKHNKVLANLIVNASKAEADINV